MAKTTSQSVQKVNPGLYNNNPHALLGIFLVCGKMFYKHDLMMLKTSSFDIPRLSSIYSKDNYHIHN